MTNNEPRPEDVERAAAELGIEVPPNFLYLGAGEALNVGPAHTMQATAAILARLDGTPVDQCWPAPETETDPRTLTEQLADWEERRGNPPHIWMGGKRVLEVWEHAPQELTPTERLVLGVIAQNINDTDPDRLTWPDLTRETLAKRAGTNPDGLKKALQRLRDRGLEVRVPLGKDKNGRPLFAVPGKQCRYRLPVFEGVTTVPPCDGEGGNLVTPGGNLVTPGGTKSPPWGDPQSPPTHPPHSSSLSVAERVVREAGVVAEGEEREFIGWINRDGQERGLGWWRKLSTNGDLAALADKWRTDRRATESDPATMAEAAARLRARTIEL